MNLAALLENRREEIVAAANEALTRAHLQHYETSGEELNRQHLSKLYDLTLDCVRTMSLIPIVEYSHQVARERHRDGFDLQEVQTAFNVLEEVIWKRITAELPPQEYPEAFGLTSTVLGAGKQALAVEYVALASHKRQSLDLTALFQGVSKLN